MKNLTNIIRNVSKVKILEEMNFVLNPLSINIGPSAFHCLQFQEEGIKIFCTILTMPSLMISGYAYVFNDSLNLHR